MEKLWEWMYDEDRLVTSPALLIGMISIAGSIVAIDNLVKDLITNGVKRRLAIYFAMEILWVGFWLYKRQALPRVKKGKIGIIIALSTENNKDKIRLKRDFVKALNQLLTESRLDTLIDIVLLKNYQAERLVPNLQRYQVQLGRF